MMQKRRSHILLVEDSIDDVTFVRRAFQKANVPANIVTVPDGDEAVQYLSGLGRYSDRQEWPLPAVMLVDVKLPRKSGHDFLAWLEEQGDAVLRRIPVVMLTSSRRQADINLAYDRGANSYLVKPVALNDLVELCETFGKYWLRWNEFPSG
jgi:CheY-like chemotaxis protein